MLKILIIILLSLPVSRAGFCAEDSEYRVRVLRNNAILKGTHDEVKCPRGTEFAVLKKENDAYLVTGEIFGVKIQGYISVEDVEKIDSGVKKSYSEHEITPPVLSKDIKYLGKTLSSEFVQFFHKKVTENLLLKNRNTLELIPKSQKTPQVLSIVDCASLRTGDFVFLEGLFFDSSPPPPHAVVILFNELYSFRSRPVYVRQKKETAQRNPAYKHLVVYEGEKDIPEIRQYFPNIKDFFEEADESERALPVRDFLAILREGRPIQLPCQECGGTGERTLKLRKKRDKCNFCRGTGFMSTQKTMTYLEKEFKKIRENADSK